jgi:hypothetical protein
MRTNDTPGCILIVIAVSLILWAFDLADAIGPFFKMVGALLRAI